MSYHLKYLKMEVDCFFSFPIVNLMLGFCRFRKVKKRSASVSHLKRQKMSSTYHL